MATKIDYITIDKPAETIKVGKHLVHLPARKVTRVLAPKTIWNLAREIAKNARRKLTGK